MNYRTPGVYVEEISLLPASVAQSETAIPVFIGYTEIAEDDDGNSLRMTPVRIASLMDYSRLFGGPPVQPMEVAVESEAPYEPVAVNYPDGVSPFLMHHAVNLFYANGGGECFVVSVGGFEDDGSPVTPAYGPLKNGLDAIINNDEITLVVIPEAIRLETDPQHDLYKDVLAHCNDQENRFGIFDVRDDDHDAGEFRDGIGTSFLSYGAAYYPHLKTTIGYSYAPASVEFSGGPLDGASWQQAETLRSVLEIQKQFGKVKVKMEAAVAGVEDLLAPERRLLLRSMLRETEKALGYAESAFEHVTDNDFEAAEIGDAREDFDAVEALNIEDILKAEIPGHLSTLSTALGKIEVSLDSILAKVNEETGIDETNNEAVREHITAEYIASVRNLINEERIAMPPSPAMAGIYARVDRNRGVWKAPANVSINLVSAPSVKLTIAENNRLNVHSTGKSINAIRSFPGRGTLVWGARTLDGNSNEWRYIPVRRFFNMVEDSVKNASGRYVFEPNDANTWVKVKAMIENFLTTQWRAGALMGSKPEEAFFVSVGLGKTMTSVDVLEGKMIVEIGMAVVRPAEFIILRFSHKMMES